MWWILSREMMDLMIFSTFPFWQRSWWSFVFADVYLSFYIISSLMSLCVLHAGENVACRTKKRWCSGFRTSWQPVFLKLTKPTLSAIFFPSSVKNLFVSKLSGLICVLSWLECKFIRGNIWIKKIRIMIYIQKELVNLYSDCVCYTTMKNNFALPVVYRV